MLLLLFYFKYKSSFLYELKTEIERETSIFLKYEIVCFFYLWQKL